MPAAAMEPDRFWALIERTISDDQQTQYGALRAELEKLDLEDLKAFEIAYRAYLNQAYRWDLWGAAYLMNGGCSDDGFEYFRRWLVAQGRATYEAALADPDSLSDIKLRPGADGEYEFEEIYYVARDVFEERGGEGDVRDYSEREAGMDGRSPVGAPFEEADLGRRFPKLAKRFG